MDLSLVLAVSGKPDLFKMVANRSNGLIVENLNTGKTNFISARKHQFTPLESISIYTLEDTIPLKEVFQLLKKQDHAKIPPAGSSNEDIEQFFDQVVPDYDEDKVHIRDMKKVFRWYLFLHEKGMLEETKLEEEE